jgi:hypothetical protein
VTKLRSKCDCICHKGGIVKHIVPCCKPDEEHLAESRMTLSETINACIAAKRGNTEFILSFDGEEWRAGIGNPVNCVNLGESNPDIAAVGATADEAVGRLLEKLS